jgi:hypothetical protein
MPPKYGGTNHEGRFIKVSSRSRRSLSGVERTPAYALRRLTVNPADGHRFPTGHR